jgi:glycosyltransferase involved in cell wall biosynthesis
MKLAILWEQWTGYIDTCVRTLCCRFPVEVLRAHLQSVPQAPFRPENFIRSQYTYTFDNQPTENELMALLERFNPDALLVASWHRPEYRRIARSFRGRAVRIMGMDNQWQGTLKQWGGRVIAPYFIAPTYDKALVAGPRQRRFARMLGFADTSIFEPLYSCDVERFANIGKNFQRPENSNFLFVGRLVDEKGLHLLTQAYRTYRAETPSMPWGLIIAGTGPLRDLIDGVEGIEYRGFIQPAKLPALFACASCFVLPSQFEPWGVVLHEAVCAGLPVICSTACGAGDVFVQHGKNGFIFPSGSVKTLADQMVAIGELRPESINRFRERSYTLSRSITPRMWADVVWGMMQASIVS